MKGVDTGSAVQFENPLTGVEEAIQIPPDRLPPGLPDEGSGKVAVIRFRCGVPICSLGGSRMGYHG